MHDYHDGLPGFSEGQILHDGCGECEGRAKSVDGGLCHLDRLNFVRAWARATKWNQGGLSDLARAEIPLLSILWEVQLKLEYYGVPIGQLPVGVL
jgi:hypothetical protein